MCVCVAAARELAAASDCLADCCCMCVCVCVAATRELAAASNCLADCCCVCVCVCVAADRELAAASDCLADCCCVCVFAPSCERLRNETASYIRVRQDILRQGYQCRKTWEYINRSQILYMSVEIGRENIIALFWK